MEKEKSDFSFINSLPFTMDICKGCGKTGKACEGCDGEDIAKGIRTPRATKQ